MTTIPKCEACNAVLVAPHAPCDVCGTKPKGPLGHPKARAKADIARACVRGPGQPPHGALVRREFADELQRQRSDWYQVYRREHPGATYHDAAIAWRAAHPAPQDPHSIGQHAAKAMGGRR